MKYIPSSINAAEPVPVEFSEIHVANALFAFISVSPYSIPSSVINLSPFKNLMVSKSLFEDLIYLMYKVLLFLSDSLASITFITFAVIPEVSPRIVVPINLSV